jgi:Spy/CpxP family protein refolding chaperone
MNRTPYPLLPYCLHNCGKLRAQCVRNILPIDRQKAFTTEILNQVIRETKMKKALIATALIGIMGMSVALADHGGFGGGFGGCGGKGGHGGFGGRGDKMGEMLVEKLKLDDAQKTQLETIKQEQSTKMEALRTQMQEQMQALRTENETKIAAILTPEQAATFKQMQEERQKRQDERREAIKKRLESGNF